MPQLHRLNICLFFSIQFLLLCISFGQTLKFEKLTLNDGLPSSECYKVIQDREGYIWIFTEYGIVKHNGAEFFQVCTNIAPSDQNAYSVFQAGQGEIYFSNSLNRIFKVRNDSAFSIKTIESFTNSFNQPEDIVFQIVVDTNQDIYFSNYRSSFCYRPGTEKIEEIIPPSNSPDQSFHYKLINGHFFPIRTNCLPALGYFDVYTREKETIFLGKIYSTLYYENRKLEKIDDFYLLATGTHIYKMRAGEIQRSEAIESILGFKILKNHIFVLTSDGLKVFNLNLELTATYLEHKIVSDICLDRSDGIWVTTIGDGVYYCRDQTLLSYTNTDLKDDVVLFIKEDDRDIFFSNTAGGCYMLKNNKPELLHQLTGNIHCGNISHYRTGYLISTKSGLFYKSENGLMSEYTGMRNMKIYSNATRVINDNEFLSFGGVHLLHFKNDTVYRYCAIPDKYYCMTPSGPNDYLIGTKRGIYRYNTLTGQINPFSPFFADKFIIKLIYDHPGNLWISTRGRGIYLLTPDGRIIHYSDVQSLIINDIDFFGSDGIVFSTNQGLYLNHSKTKNKTTDWIFGLDEEINGVEIADSIIWIASKSGLYSQALTKLEAGQSYPILIHSVYANSGMVDPEFSKLEYNENDLRFNFNFLNYPFPVQKFYYTLNGPTTSSGTINGNVLQIQNLSPGTYILNIFPFNGITYRKDIFLSRKFEINPAYWQTYWFMLLVILAIILVSGSLVGYYYQTKRKNERAIAETNSRIAEYKLTALRSQINPHFISNLLAAIQLLIQSGDTDKANQYIAKFGLLIRYVLNYSDKNVTRLSDELKIIDLNVELEKLRFKHGFKFTKKIADDIDITDIYIPPLITQPFIENAIWHGFDPLKLNRDPEVILQVEKSNDVIIISIIDNGLGRKYTRESKKEPATEYKESKGTGIIQGRIDSINQLYNTPKAMLKIIDLYDESDQPSGTRVDLIFPVLLLTKLEEQKYESHSY